MKMPLSSLRTVTLAIGFLSGLAPARAELIVALTTQNTLLSFDTASPGTVTTIGAIAGLVAGDALVGIDRRPQALPAVYLGLITEGSTASVSTPRMDPPGYTRWMKALPLRP
jgi:hypothetical protein